MRNSTSGNAPAPRPLLRAMALLPVAFACFAFLPAILPNAFAADAAPLPPAAAPPPFAVHPAVFAASILALLCAMAFALRRAAAKASSAASAALRAQQDQLRECQEQCLDRIRSAEAALRESNERFDQVAEHSRTLVWETDADGTFSYASHAARAVLECEPDELVGPVAPIPDDDIPF